MVFSTSKKKEEIMSNLSLEIELYCMLSIYSNSFININYPVKVQK